MFNNELKVTESEWVEKPLSQWQEMIHSRSFWLHFLTASIDFSKCEGLQTLNEVADHQDTEPECSSTIKLSLPDGYYLQLTLHGPEQVLSLESFENGEWTEKILGATDCNWKRQVFRLEEFELLVSRLSERYQAPGWIYRLLLWPYVGPMRDQFSEYVQILRDSLKQSKFFIPAEMDYICDYALSTRRNVVCEWNYKSDQGWYGDNTIRQRTYNFDFKIFDKFLTALEKGYDYLPNHQPAPRAPISTAQNPRDDEWDDSSPFEDE